MPVRYNNTYKVKHKDLADQVAMVSMRYDHLIAIANVLEDIHREAEITPTDHDYPLKDYPAADLQEVHTEIRNTAINCALSLETMHESQG